ncbi:unnamed protein product [Candida parapsilosis]|uniref:Uncharacterized protein n=1 Tax=Candida parapsilosis (strain CDC 317 / ATCC MYA-4646) TaxID=578454 RepID=G8B7R5_CANPC|nr:uncharacterized protein CPAR2_105360 [Candida parapsilosis]CAD1809850.1 unnamed protein product [Candida parapsilosis]CCE40500.1 hypothetical protein CPAR2_105360 [Candida parapsilosis]
MYTYQMKPTSKASAALLIGYLSISTTLPFILSYKESTMNLNQDSKGTASFRSLFTKI